MIIIEKKVSILSLVKNYWPLVVLLIIFGFLFANLLSSHMLYQKPDGLYSGGSTWGDLAFHLSLISNFSQSGLNLKINPIFEGSHLTYPFLIDLISSWMVNAGISIRLALIIPSFIFVIIFVILFYLLALKITKSKIGAFLAPFIFFFNGTIFGLYYFWQDFQASHLGLQQFLGSITKDYAHLPDYNVHFSNIICDFILSQRAFAPGLVLGFIVIYFLWEYWQKEKRKYLIYAGIVLSLMPIVHTHSFVALSIVCVFLVIIQFFSSPKDFFVKKIFFDWMYFAIPILFIGLPTFLLIYPWGRESFLRIQFGWLHGKENIFWFWIKNLTPHIFLFAIAYFFSSQKLKKFYLAFLFLFILTNIIIFQPNDWDNMKLMIWWFLMSVILISNIFGVLIKRFSSGYFRKCAGVLFIILIFISLTITGVLSVYRESNISWLMFSNEDVALANFIKSNTPKDSIFLTSDTHKHPVSCLAGRQIVMGYRGWLWTYGINYSQRENDVINIFNGSANATNLIQKYNIKYVVLDRFRAVDFKMNYDFFAKNFPLIYKSENYLIYKTD